MSTISSFASMNKSITNAIRKLFDCKLHKQSDNIVGNIGRFRSGRYMVDIRREKESHKFNTSIQIVTLDMYMLNRCCPFSNSLMLNPSSKSKLCGGSIVNTDHFVLSSMHVYLSQIVSINASCDANLRALVVSLLNF